MYPNSASRFRWAQQTHSRAYIEHLILLQSVTEVYWGKDLYHL